MRTCLWLLALLALGLSACSDDTTAGDKGPGTADRRIIDYNMKAEIPPLIPDQSTLKADAAGWACTPGAANMCNGFKTQYCNNGVCTTCPTDSVDCDRKGDCECKGLCQGTTCKTP
jgi:hypothetical protein